MGYRNTSLYTLKYVSHLLDVDEEWLHESSIGMYSENGCLSVHDEYPSSELSESIVVFTENGIENLRCMIEDQTEAGEPPKKREPESDKPM
jgi:hypothetical protein